jgi:hypothetical protein
MKKLFLEARPSFQTGLKAIRSFLHNSKENWQVQSKKQVHKLPQNMPTYQPQVE